MDNKYLWSIIDVLREELSSGTEYGKLQAEIKSLEKLIEAKHKKRNEDSNLIAELKLVIVDQNDDIKTLKVDNKWLANRNGEIIKEKDAWINDLKAEIKELKDVIIKDLECDLKQAIKLRDKFGQERDDNRKNIDILKMEIKTLKQNNHYKMNLTTEIDHLKAVNKENNIFLKNLEKENEELKAENDSLKDEAVKWNRKYNQVEYPKDYQKEAKEHFHHNPNCKGVRFHMIDFDEYDYDNNDGLNGLSGEYNGSLMAEDCLLEIDNNTTRLKFH